MCENNGQKLVTFSKMSNFAGQNRQESIHLKIYSNYYEFKNNSACKASARHA